MNLKLEIRRNADGKIVTDTWPDWDFNQFWWEDGNAQCDGKYSVRLSDADTGEILYDEFGA